MVVRAEKLFMTGSFNETFDQNCHTLCFDVVETKSSTVGFPILDKVHRFFQHISEQPGLHLFVEAPKMANGVWKGVQS